MVDLVQATQEAWKKNDELREENRRLIIALHDAEEEIVNLREIVGLPLD